MNTDSNANAANAQAPSIDPRLLGRQIIGGLGSLKITVFLLALGLLLVLIATLQQSRRDIHQIKQQHFRAPVVFVEYQELLTPAWFPNYQDVGGGFLMPSGAAILFAMLLNLFCAHATRFRIQAKGRRLLIGAVFLTLGIVTTMVVISNGNARGRFQEEPLIPWDTQWLLLQGLLGAAALAGLAGSALLESRVRRTFSLWTGLALAGALAFVLYKGEDAFIGDDAMRVVWRLLQGSIAAVVCYIGALMVFRRKAGIVVIHTGLLLLMVGELYTTYSAVEQRLFFYEGDTTRHAIDVNRTELAVISDSTSGDDTEDVVVVPARRMSVDGTLVDERLPFDIKVVAYYPNSDLVTVKPDDNTVPNAKGLAEIVFAQPIAEVSGTGMEASSVNAASAYVQITDRRDGKDLGTYLISQQLYQNPDFDLDAIKVDGKDYRIGLRYKHFYKPYSVFLKSTTRTNYTGTETPRTYSSTFRIIDPENNVDELKEVSMNNPLRYNNETFYQAGHDTDKSGRTYSVLQVVRNTGWMIPYVSCAMVGIGLVLHFLGIFVRFVERLGEKRDPSRRYDKTSIAMVLGFVLLFAMFAYRKVPEPTIYEGMDLHRFGQIPVAFKGRVQPLSSLARSTLRELRKYEIPVKMDREAEKEIAYPPVQWLADWIYGAPGADEYRIFKIENPQIINALDLIRRKSHLYSIAELQAVRDEIDKYFRAAIAVKERDKSAVSIFQKKMIELETNIQVVEMLRYALGTPEAFGPDDPIQALGILSNARIDIQNVPLAIPGADENDWSVLSPLYGPQWLKSMSEKYETVSTRELAQKLIGDDFIDRLQKAVEQREFRRALIATLGLDPANVDERQLDDVISLISRDDPESMKQRATLERMIQPRVDAAVEMQVQGMTEQVISAIQAFVPAVDGNLDFDHVGEQPAICDLPAAYLDKDATAFNAAVENHLATVQKTPDVGSNWDKVLSESFLNRLAPFYLATAILIGSFLLCLLSWLFLTGAQNSERWSSLATAAGRSGFWLVVGAFALFSLGLYLRIFISGRPPVTNLYSSALFIGWAGVLMGIITERMLGYSFGTVMSSVIGVVTYLIAFALGSEGDTFAVLQAVLDTQFWLSTHVVSITIGYAGTLVAGFLGIVYLLVSMFVPYNLVGFRKTLGKMVYGVTCLSLIFSFVGTVLGGLWADDSWGRFWGWDPKENGALMIVLVNAILLHARWAGMIKERGMAMVAILGNVVTLWSWFAVNELGIGLHTYGLTEGRMFWVASAWAAHLGLIGIAFVPTRFWLGNIAANRLTPRREGAKIVP